MTITRLIHDASWAKGYTYTTREFSLCVRERVKSRVQKGIRLVQSPDLFLTQNPRGNPSFSQSYDGG